MDSGDGRQMVANSTTEKTSDENVTEQKKQPTGTVERILNFQDRSLLAFAARVYCGKEGKGDHKAQSKLTRLMALLSYQETVEYFDLIDDSVEDALFKWQRARNDWLSLQQYLAGGLTLEGLKKKTPALDLESPPEKPPRSQPKATPEEVRGKERAFYFPSKIDSWAQDVLRAMSWPNPEKAEYITELCGKFGIKEED